LPRRRVVGSLVGVSVIPEPGASFSVVGPAFLSFVAMVLVALAVIVSLTVKFVRKRRA